MKLTINFDATDGVWYAFEGERPEDSRWIGEGPTAEDACSDYWWQRNQQGKKVAIRREIDLIELYDGRGQNILFASVEAARNFANSHGWCITAEDL